LIFTYYWPPAGGVAVQRFLKFSKYLPQFGWEPIIVTVKNGSYPYYDESQLKEVPASIKVYRTKTFEPFELYNLLRAKRGKSVPVISEAGEKKRSVFQRIAEYIRANHFLPDARKGWVPYAVKQAEEILENEKIDVIITTGPPQSAHLIGLRLKEKYGIKWVADFRDPWSTILYNKFLPRTASTKAKDQKLEAEVLENADKVLLISKSLSEEFSVPVPSPAVIYNGFDEEDYRQPAIETEGKFTIRYVGNVLAAENPPGLFRAIKKLLDTNEEFRKYFRFELTGRVDGLVMDEMRSHGLGPWIETNGFVSHAKAIQLMKGANILLLLFLNIEGNKAHMTGKIFEYIATCNPIIGFGHTSGEATQLLQEIGREPLLDYEDEKGATILIEKYFNQWSKDRNRFQYNNDNYLSLSRRELTKKLANILNLLAS